MTYELSRERDSVREDIENPDEEIRRLGVERLLSLPAAEAIPWLIERLGDPSWRVRKAAVGRLVACSEVDRVTSALIEALADGENPGRRNSAVEALMALGEAVTPALIASLATEDSDVRKLIVDALAGVGDPASRDALIGVLSDTDANVRAAAADALGVLGGADGATALLASAVSEGEDQLVRFSALRALARLECAVTVDRLAGVLADPVLRAGGLALLGYCDLDEEAVSHLLKALSATSRAPREAAMSALMCQFSRRDGNDAAALVADIRATVRATAGLVEAAAERLAAADLTTRLMLIQFLGLAAVEQSVAPILECARDEAVHEVAMATLEALGDVTERAIDAVWASLDGDLRRSACELLARTRGATGTARLREALEDPDGTLRAAAALALGDRGAVEVLPDLVRRLEATALDAEPDAADELEAISNALIAMVGNGSGDVVSEAVALLAGHMQDASESVRCAAAGVFTAIGRAEDVPRMTQLLKDPSAQVRRLAVEGLTRFDSEEAAEPLRFALADESPLVRVASASALGGSRNEAVLEDLGRLVRDEDPRVRAAALRAIAGYCAKVRSNGSAECDTESRAIELLGSALAGDENGGMVTMAALEALDRLGGTAIGALAVSALASPEPEVVQAAVGCIGRHGDEACLANLIPVVQHAAWAVRAEAIQTLSDRNIVRALPAILRQLENEQDTFVRDVIMRSLRKLEG